MPRRGGLQGLAMTPSQLGPGAPVDPQTSGLAGLLNAYWRGGVAGAPIEYAPVAPSADHYRIATQASEALEALAAGEPPLLFMNRDDEPAFHELAAAQERQWSSPSRIFEGTDQTGGPIGVRWASPEAWQIFGPPTEPFTATLEETRALMQRLGLPFNPVMMGER
jgi:hypothetical protein